MFLKIREENEKEISTLKSIMQSLEARLSVALLDSDDGGLETVEPKGANKVFSCTFVSLDLVVPIITSKYNIIMYI